MHRNDLEPKMKMEMEMEMEMECREEEGWEVGLYVIS